MLVARGRRPRVGQSIYHLLDALFDSSLNWKYFVESYGGDGHSAAAGASLERCDRPVIMDTCPGAHVSRALLIIESGLPGAQVRRAEV